jgi:hypothetical protein
MQLGWLWLLLIGAWLVNLVLLGWALRLRMEVWANRRVIAALEAAAIHPARKEQSNRTIGVGIGFVVVALAHFFLMLLSSWQ